MSSRFTIASLLTVVVVTISGCGSGGTSSAVTTPVLNKTAVSSGMNPSPDGFAFANFGSSASTAELDTADMVTMFGTTKDICVKAATPCVLTAQASAWVRMVNQARISGHCEGLAVLSAARYMDKVDPKTFTLTNTGDVTHALIRAFATQFFKETQDATNKYSKKSPSDIVAILSASLQKDLPEYTLGVYSDKGGHAILPIGVEFPTPEIAHIKVYDSNWPGKDRYVEVDLKKQTWKFSFSGVDPASDPNAWTGGTGDIDITPFSARIAATCPFCGGKSGVQKSLLLVRSALPNWSIETADGIITPGSSDVGDSRVRPVRAADTGSSSEAPTDYLVSTSIGNSGITLHLGSASRVSGVTPDAVFEVNAPTTKTETPISITNTSASVNDPTVKLTVAHANLVASAAGNSNTVSSSPDAVSVVLTTSDGKVVSEKATSTTPAIDVRSSAADGVAAGVSYEVRTQVGPTQIETVTVRTDGTETTTKSKDVLDNQKSTVVLPDELKAPEVKNGLSARQDREMLLPQSSTTVGTTTSTVAPVATTIKPSSTTLKPATTTTTVKSLSSYKVGDTGPGGGLVFYKASTRQSWGQFLEVAVVDFKGAFGCEGTLINGADGTGLGTGRQNTSDILSGCATKGTAARIATDYRGGGKSDWYLPSKDELSAMSSANRKYNLGYSGFFQSSTESDAISSWWHGFDNDDENITPKSYAEQQVAPIRSF